jgi:hypothetical protein
MLTLTFARERETKNTIRYAEQGADAEQAVGTLYVKKSALAKVGNPETIGVVIGDVKEFDERNA